MFFVCSEWMENLEADVTKCLGWLLLCFGWLFCFVLFLAGIDVKGERMNCYVI